MRFCKIEFFINALIEKFETHAGNDRESPEMEAVLSKDGAVPCLAGVQVAQHATFRIGRTSALIAAIL